MVDENKSKTNALKEFKKTVNEYKQSHETIQSNLNEIETIQRQVSCRFEDYLETQNIYGLTPLDLEVLITQRGLTIQLGIANKKFMIKEFEEMITLVGMPTAVKFEDYGLKILWVIEGDS